MAPAPLPTSSYIPPSNALSAVNSGPYMTMPSSSFVRKALFVDATLNLFGTLPFVLCPHRTLSLLVPPSSITPLSLVLFQWFGWVSAVISVPMFIATTAQSNARERRLAYSQLVALETGLIILLGWQYAYAGTGIEGGIFAGFAACFAPFCAWSVYVLAVGESKDSGENVRGKKSQ